jgi:hypothetical protein
MQYNAYEIRLMRAVGGFGRLVQRWYKKAGRLVSVRISVRSAAGASVVGYRQSR